MLTLYEELFLLTIHEEKGTVLSSTEACLPFGLAGAVLAELALLGKAQVGDNHRLELRDPAPTGDGVLDDALAEVQAENRARKVSYWINTFSLEPKKMRKRLTEQLIVKEVVSQEDKRLLWIIPYAASPGQYASAKYSIKNRLRSLVLACEESRLREIALLTLLHACNQLDLVFTKDERKMAARRTQELLVGEALRNSVGQTLEEIESAIAAVVEDD